MRSEVMSLSEASEIPGLRAVFGEVYPDPVRVVSLGPSQLVKLPCDICGIRCLPLFSVDKIFWLLLYVPPRQRK